MSDTKHATRKLLSQRSVPGLIFFMLAGMMLISTSCRGLPWRPQMLRSVHLGEENLRSWNWPSWWDLQVIRRPCIQGQWRSTFANERSAYLNLCHWQHRNCKACGSWISSSLVCSLSADILALACCIFAENCVLLGFPKDIPPCCQSASKYQAKLFDSLHPSLGLRAYLDIDLRFRSGKYYLIAFSNSVSTQELNQRRVADIAETPNIIHDLLPPILNMEIGINYHLLGGHSLVSYSFT